MPSFSLVSTDTVFCRAVREQIEQFSLWQDSVICAASDFDEAVSRWSTQFPDVVLVDDMALKGKGQLEEIQNNSSLFFLLCDSVLEVEFPFLTEIFYKPVRLGFLVARLHFHLQVRAQNSDLRYSLGPWLFLPRQKQLCHSSTGEIVALADKESGLLEFLIRTKLPVSRQEILGAVWGYQPGIDTHTLETHLYRLRRKLALENSADDLFVVEQGKYSLNPSWRTV